MERTPETGRLLMADFHNLQELQRDLMGTYLRMLSLESSSRKQLAGFRELLAGVHEEIETTRTIIADLSSSPER